MYGVIALIFALLITVFSIQNVTSVSINFLTWHFTNVPLVLVILLSSITGALVIFFYTLFNTFSLKRELSAVKKAYDKLETQLAQKSQLATTNEELVSNDMGKLV